MKNSILLEIFYWLIGTLTESEIDNMGFGDEAYHIWFTANKYGSAWNMNRYFWINK